MKRNATHGHFTSPHSLMVLALLVISLPSATSAVERDPASGGLAAAVTATGVTLTWTASGDDGNTGTGALYDLRYSKQPITLANWDNASVVFQVSDEPAPLPAGTIQSYALTGLDTSSTYFAAIRAGDEVGNWSGLSNVVSWTTTEDAPPGPISSLTATSSTDTSITLRWYATGDNGTTGTATLYDLRYSTTLITATNWNTAVQVDGEPTPSAPGTLQTMTVTGLTPGTQYYFAIKVADEVPNWSPLSNITGRATLTQSPPNAIADLDSASVTASSVTIRWTVPAGGSTSEPATLYDIRYSTVPITDANWNSITFCFDEPSPLTAGSTQFHAIDNLDPGTTYYIAVKVRYGLSLWSGLSNVASVTTATTGDTTPPAAISDLHNVP